MLLPGVGAHDPRIPADSRAPPWTAVALLQVPGVSRCTAVMVAPHWAAAAAHCLYGRRLGHVVPVEAVHLLLGYDGGQYLQHIIPDAIRFADGADPAAKEAPRGSDLALLHLHDPVAAILLPEPAAVQPGTPLVLGGFGQDRAERLAIDPGCEAAGYVRGTDGGALLRHDCAGTRGTSGGAVLLRTPDGGWRLAGLQVGADVAGAGGVAVPGQAVLALIRTVQ